MAGAVGEAYTVMGDSVNVAARLQGAAAPGTIVVGPATVEASRSAIVYEELGPVHLKGKAEAVPAWRALRAVPRPDGRRAVDTPLIGRDRELAFLEGLVDETVADGSLRVVHVVGEPGVGKTRIVRELIERVEARTDGTAMTVRRGATLPYGATSAFGAMAEVLRQEIGVALDDTAADARHRMHEWLRGLLGDEARAARLTATLAPLVGVADSTEAGDDPDEADAARDALFAAVRLVLRSVARRGPLLIVLEDLHWADDALTDLIDVLAQTLDAPVLVVTTGRPEVRGRLAHSSVASDRWHVLDLLPLAGAEIARLVAELGPGAGDLPVEVIVDRCGGNPLFAEELVRHLVDRPDKSSAAEAALPATLHGLLTARLDLLRPVERQVLQRASVLGTSFPLAALRWLSEDADLAMDGLTDHGFVLVTDGECSFRHALVRDAAYKMAPKGERSRCHVRAAEFLEASSEDGGELVVALRAQHYLQAARLAAEARLPEPECALARSTALRLLLVAGDRAGGLGANAEALAHYEAAASLSTETDEIAELTDRIGDAAMRSGDVERAIHAWTQVQGLLPDDAAARLGDLDRKLGRARALAGEREQAIHHFETGINRLLPLSPDRRLIRLYEEASAVYLDSGENMLAVFMSEKALRLAGQLDLAAAISRAHVVFGVVNGRRGDVSAARTNLETAMRSAADADDASQIAALRAMGRHRLVHETDADGARDRFHEALQLAEDLGDVPLQLDVTRDLADVALRAAAWDEVERLADRCADLEAETGLRAGFAAIDRLRGWLCWIRGDDDGAAERFRRSHETARVVGATEAAVNALIGAATVERYRGERGEALAQLAEARRLCEGASLTVLHIEVVATEAMLLATHEDGPTTMEKVERLAAGAHSPTSHVTALECRGVVKRDVVALAEARDRWEALGRPWEAARADLERGRVLAQQDAVAAVRVLEAVADRLDTLGMASPATYARQLARERVPDARP